MGGTSFAFEACRVNYGVSQGPMPHVGRYLMQCVFVGFFPRVPPLHYLSEDQHIRPGPTPWQTFSSPFPWHLLESIYFPSFLSPSSVLIFRLRLLFPPPARLFGTFRQSPLSSFLTWLVVRRISENVKPAVSHPWSSVSCF